jgi:hypothetical protein
MPGFVGRYTTSTLIEKRLGTENFLLAFDKDGDGAADDVVLETAITAAEAIVDVKLKASHGAPFTGTIPQAIVDIATILSPFEGTRFSPHGKAYRQLWEDGMSLLRDLARDREARLPSGASQPIATGEGWVDAPAPLFGAATVSAESDPSGSSGGGFSGF